MQSYMQYITTCNRTRITHTAYCMPVDDQHSHRYLVDHTGGELRDWAERATVETNRRRYPQRRQRHIFDVLAAVPGVHGGVARQRQWRGDGGSIGHRDDRVAIRVVWLGDRCGQTGRVTHPHGHELCHGRQGGWSLLEHQHPGTGPLDPDETQPFHHCSDVEWQHERRHGFGVAPGTCHKTLLFRGNFYSK